MNRFMECGCIPGDVDAFKPIGGKMKFYLGGDSGGGAAPSSNVTSYTASVQPELLPYAQDIAGKSQALTAANYTPYQGQRIAGFNPNQQQTQANTMALQTPGQFGSATGLAGASGVGSMMAGQNYAQQATSPDAMAAYMSPYQQNVTDWQKQQAINDYGRALPGVGAQAVNAGAFGGTRHAVVEAEGQRNLQNQLAGIQATGSQNAFQNAQQAQQYGANLNLQGMGQANQSAANLGQIGTAQQATDLSRLQAQAGVGAQQQALSQQGLTQNYQDFLKQQEYPYSQLAFYNSMVRGLAPVMPTTTQTYNTPNPLAQASGLGLGAYSLGKMMG